MVDESHFRIARQLHEQKQKLTPRGGTSTMSSIITSCGCNTNGNATNEMMKSPRWFDGSLLLRTPRIPITNYADKSKLLLTLINTPRDADGNLLTNDQVVTEKKTALEDLDCLKTQEDLEHLKHRIPNLPQFKFPDIDFKTGTMQVSNVQKDHKRKEYFRHHNGLRIGETRQEKKDRQEEVRKEIPQISPRIGKLEKDCKNPSLLDELMTDDFALAEKSFFSGYGEMDDRNLDKEILNESAKKGVNLSHLISQTPGSVQQTPIQTAGSPNRNPKGLAPNGKTWTLRQQEPNKATTPRQQEEMNRISLANNTMKLTKEQQYLKFDGKILRFGLVLHDLFTEAYERRFFVLSYYLSDNSTTIWELKTEARSPCCFFRRNTLPNFNILEDLKALNTYVTILSREFYVYKADAFTKEYFKKCIGRDISIHPETGEHLENHEEQLEIDLKELKDLPDGFDSTLYEFCIANKSPRVTPRRKTPREEKKPLVFGFGGIHPVDPETAGQYGVTKNILDLGDDDKSEGMMHAKKLKQNMKADELVSDSTIGARETLSFRVELLRGAELQLFNEQMSNLLTGNGNASGKNPRDDLLDTGGEPKSPSTRLKEKYRRQTSTMKQKERRAHYGEFEVDMRKEPRYPHSSNGSPTQFKSTFDASTAHPNNRPATMQTYNYARNTDNKEHFLLYNLRSKEIMITNQFTGSGYHQFDRNMFLKKGVYLNSKTGKPFELEDFPLFDDVEIMLNGMTFRVIQADDFTHEFLEQYHDKKVGNETAAMIRKSICGTMVGSVPPAIAPSAMEKQESVVCTVKPDEPSAATKKEKQTPTVTPRTSGKKVVQKESIFEEEVGDGVLKVTPSIVSGESIKSSFDAAKKMQSERTKREQKNAYDSLLTPRTHLPAKDLAKLQFELICKLRGGFAYLRDCFRYFDHNRDSLICFEDFSLILKHYGYFQLLEKEKHTMFDYFLKKSGCTSDKLAFSHFIDVVADKDFPDNTNPTIKTHVS